MTIRRATHAGSWYSSSKQALKGQISSFLSESKQAKVPGARVLVGPHAGYAYAGPILGKAYSALDTDNIQRVFIFGPSHHVYYKGCVLTTSADYYDTPFGKLEVDNEVINELIDSDSHIFKKMNLDVDEDEHSLEMHMPFLYSVTNNVGKKVKIVPIMISASDETFEKKLTKYLKPYFNDKSNAFIVSTDFCHWGIRFSYISYTPTGDLKDLVEKPSSKLQIPIYESIKCLDTAAMTIMSTGSYRSFKDYMMLTENTICGAKPLALLMLLMEDFISNREENTIKFNGYAQSSKVVSLRDSSVSYGSGYAVI
ncbi:uncharacterized protein C5L36_0A08130 [Pichia kudriavzevii]|uniref:Protein MEMO1 n=2 Tax=Pichia kudriavzevii TaxID=4909 RepID=A0A2U9QYY7_PICKU|nr:uncharacterized protein C5L36_0A08130 [Pichia kudriavzevii]AWU74215.1 hypothetical protein C5L36_0A08130 [Pichia kudriavzevii]